MEKPKKTNVEDLKPVIQEAAGHKNFLPLQTVMESEEANTPSRYPNKSRMSVIKAKEI